MVFFHLLASYSCNFTPPLVFFFSNPNHVLQENASVLLSLLLLSFKVMISSNILTFKFLFVFLVLAAIMAEYRLLQQEDPDEDILLSRLDSPEVTVAPATTTPPPVRQAWPRLTLLHYCFNGTSCFMGFVGVLFGVFRCLNFNSSSVQVAGLWISSRGIFKTQSNLHLPLYLLIFAGAVSILVTVYGLTIARYRFGHAINVSLIFSSPDIFHQIKFFF